MVCSKPCNIKISNVSLKSLPLSRVCCLLCQFFHYPYADINECADVTKKEELCGIKGSCKNLIGSYLCECPKGYTNYGNERTPCSGESLPLLPDLEIKYASHGCNVLISIISIQIAHRIFFSPSFFFAS